MYRVKRCGGFQRMVLASKGKPKFSVSPSQGLVYSVVLRLPVMECMNELI